MGGALATWGQDTATYNRGRSCSSMRETWSAAQRESVAPIRYIGGQLVDGRTTVRDCTGADAQLLVRLQCSSRGLKFMSKLRRERLSAIAERLAGTDYDVVGLQEVWVESEDWRAIRAACKSTYPYSYFFLTFVFSYLH